MDSGAEFFRLRRHWSALQLQRSSDYGGEQAECSECTVHTVNAHVRMAERCQAELQLKRSLYWFSSLKRKQLTMGQESHVVTCGVAPLPSEWMEARGTPELLGENAS